MINSKILFRSEYTSLRFAESILYPFLKIRISFFHVQSFLAHLFFVLIHQQSSKQFNDLTYKFSTTMRNNLVHMPKKKKKSHL